MGFRSILAKPFAAIVASETKKWSLNPELSQQKTFRSLIQKGAPTVFGKDHGFGSIQSYDEFKKQVKGACDFLLLDLKEILLEEEMYEAVNEVDNELQRRGINSDDLDLI